MARQRSGWQSKQIADIIGIDPATLSRFEHGKSIPRPAYMIAMAWLYAMTPVELYNPADVPDGLRGLAFPKVAVA